MQNSDLKYYLKRLNESYSQLSEKLKSDFIDEAWTKSVEIEINSIINELKTKCPEKERIQKFLLSDLNAIRFTSKSGQVDWLITKIQKLLDILKAEFNFKSGSVESDPISRIEHLFLKFHAVVIQLRHRHDNAETLDVQNEYDVQDLLHALLKIDFDDVRPEEWTPSYAGASSRMDFVLPGEKIVIETKKTRKGLDSKKLGEELIIDIEKYQKHPDCQLLYCFIYDPEEHITNPTGLIKDLERNIENFSVRVIISPKKY